MLDQHLKALQQEMELDEPFAPEAPGIWSIPLDDNTAATLTALQPEGYSITCQLGTLPEEQVAPVRAALVAYLRGDAASARTQLEEIAVRADTLDPRVRAHVLAWLGVAYADLAITARAEAERAELRARALERFGQLLATEPGYEFRDRLISPQILELLNQARTKK